MRAYLGIFNVFMPLLSGERGVMSLSVSGGRLTKSTKENTSLGHLLLMLPVATEAAFDSL